MSGHEIVLRPAVQSDAADLAILDNLAGHGISLWFWQGAVKRGIAEDAFEWGRTRFLDENAPYAWRNTIVAERDDVVMGAANGYVMPEMDPEESKSDVIPFVPVMELFSLTVGGWILDSLAVFSHERGNGIGKMLLDDAVSRATVSEAPRMHLVAEDSNKSALALYESRGFSTVEERPYIQFGFASESTKWLLMTKPL